MPNDFELIQQAQQGHRLAFRDLVLRYQKRAYYFAYDLTGNHFDAQDLSQEVFMQIYNSLENYRGESQFSTWLYRITVNTWSNSKRRRNAKMRALLDTLEDTNIDIQQSKDLSSPEQQTDQSLMYEHIQQATNRLSPKEKSVFVLRQFQDQKLEDIAEILNIKIGTVKSLLFRALKKMQKELSFYQQDSERMS